MRRRATAAAIGAATWLALLAVAGAAAQEAAEPPDIEPSPLLAPAGTEAANRPGAGALEAAAGAGGADLIALTGRSDPDAGSSLPVEAQVAPLDGVPPTRTELSDRIAALGVTAESAVLAIILTLPFAYLIGRWIARQRRRARRRRRARERAREDYGLL